MVQCLFIRRKKQTMLQFSNAKINLGLYVTEKRSDGFHNIETLFYPIQWKDVVELVPAPQLNITVYNNEIPGEALENLCCHAWKILNKAFDIPPVHIHLLKNLPIGAGLGGGSSNATFTLIALNNLFKLELSDLQLEAFASELGSDCPFFVKNKAVLAKARGNEFESIELSLKEYQIALIWPDIHVATGWAYGQLNPQSPTSSIKEIIQKPVKEWRDHLNNDFEKVVYTKYPQIERIKEFLYEQGAIFSLMSGSGSTVFGIFEKNIALTPIESYCQENNYRWHTSNL